jgi:hypothetical protein
MAQLCREYCGFSTGDALEQQRLLSTSTVGQLSISRGLPCLAWVSRAASGLLAALHQILHMHSWSFVPVIHVGVAADCARPLYCADCARSSPMLGQTCVVMLGSFARQYT